MFPKIDKTKIDNMHFEEYARKLLSYNKPKMLALTPRELGKSTWWWLFAYNRTIEKGETHLYFKYFQADVMDVTIDDICSLLNKFLLKPVSLKYKRGSIKDGVVDVKLVDPETKKEINFFRVAVINLPLRRLKSLFYSGLRWCIFDEYMLDTRTANEKYPEQVSFKLTEIFKTFNRESDGKLRMIFFGNPYSKFSPVHQFIGIRSKDLQIDKITVGDDFVAAIFSLPDQLIKYIKERDKNYKFEESYLMYAVFGESINDTQIRILDKQPKNYILRYVFYVENQKLLIYQNYGVNIYDDAFWVTVNNKYSSERRDILTFNYNSLIDGTVLLSNELKKNFRYLANCYRYRRVQFSSIDASYLFEQVFNEIE